MSLKGFDDSNKHYNKSQQHFFPFTFRAYSLIVVEM